MSMVQQSSAEFVIVVIWVVFPAFWWLDALHDFLPKGNAIVGHVLPRFEGFFHEEEAN